MLNIVISYLGAGLLFFLVMAIRQKLSPRNLFETAEEDGIWGFIQKYVVPVLGILILLIGWPIFFYRKIKELLTVRENLEEKKFIVSKQSLIKKLSIADIEKLEIVKDPLNAVPKIPFGHLNSAWLSFKQQISPDDTVWSFNSDWTNSFGSKQQLTGYVIVKDDSPGAYILTDRRIMDK
jgi:hypothetical protein